MTDCEAFYRGRDPRTLSYMDEGLRTGERIVVAAGPRVASTEAGQFLLLTLANLLPRVHRQIDFALPDVGASLRAWAPFSDADELAAGLLETAKTLDPCGDFRSQAELPAGDLPGVGVGENAPAGLPWYVGARGGVARLDQEAVPVDNSYGRGSLRGAGLAACLGASAVFQSLHDVAVCPRRLSAWNYREGSDAATGPSDLQPVDPGRVLLMGAGAVGSALAFWLRAWGVGGTWTVVDGDHVELHNTNRSLLFTPGHAGWPDGEGVRKADVVARALPDARSVPEWYDEADDVRERPFDVVLPLANERDVRGSLATRNEVVLLHATTGRDWVSQLHRHVKGVDDCLACRMVGVVPMDDRCSEVEVEKGADREGGDAALPYLSAASGLMLATALQRLGAGLLVDLEPNDVRWYFNSEQVLAHGSRRSPCDEECDSTEPPALRSRLSRGRRWRALDPAVAG